MLTARLEGNRYDVVVVGGGAGGVAAAVGAARTGASVCLVEQHGFLGGAATASSVLTYCGFFDRAQDQVVAGVGQQFLDRLAADDLYLTQVSQESGNKIVLLDLETTKRVLDDLVISHGITLLLRARAVASAEVADGVLDSIDVAHPAGVQRLKAGAFVDASGDGAVLHAAGLPTRVVPVAMRQASTMVVRVGNVAEDGLLDHQSMARAVRGYEASTGIALGREHGAAVRMPLSREVMLLVADQHRDMLDPAEAKLAAVEGRRLAMHYAAAFRSTLAGWQNSYLAATGPEIGVRESRHLVGRATVTAEDVVSGRRRPDEVVARGGWSMEDHAVPGRTRYTEIRDGGWYDIPLDALRSVAAENVWAAGRLVSADDQAYSSLRVMGTAFATGHAAGVAAAITVRNGRTSCHEVQNELRSQGALL